MLKISSIFNSNQLPYAFLFTILAVSAVEIYGASNFPRKYFNHEVDTLVYKLDRRQFNEKYLLIGDSIGLQTGRQLKQRGDFVILATNQAVEITGNYFLTKRYLLKNPKPEAVFLVSLPFLDRNLDQIYTENFIHRVFTKNEEIWDIVKTIRDPAIACRMFFYKSFPTYKYKLKIQSDLIGFSNAHIYSGIDNLAKHSSAGDYSILNLLQSTFPSVKTSAAHFRELLSLLEENNIDLYYIPAPLSNNNQVDVEPMKKLLSKDLPAIQKEFNNLKYIDNIVFHDKNLFADGIHYTDEGLAKGEKYVSKSIQNFLGPVEQEL